MASFRVRICGIGCVYDVCVYGKGGILVFGGSGGVCDKVPTM